MGEDAFKNKRGFVFISLSYSPLLRNMKEENNMSTQNTLTVPHYKSTKGTVALLDDSIKTQIEKHLALGTNRTYIMDWLKKEYGIVVSWNQLRYHNNSSRKG